MRDPARRARSTRPAGVRVRVQSKAPGGPERVEQAFELGAAAKTHFEGVLKVELTINNNRRRLLSWRQRGDTLQLSVHHQVLGAPEDVLAVVTRRDPQAWSSLLERIHAAPPAPNQGPALEPRGAAHDLADILQEVDRSLFDGRFHDHPELQVGWGRWPRVAPRRGLRLGSCSHNPLRIRVHPSLDHAATPRWFISFVLYHELLHVVVPPERTASGRRRVHPPAFRALERAHPQYAEAVAWEHRNIDRLIRRTAAKVRARA